MLPIGNEDQELRERYVPFVTYGLILVNILCFIFEHFAKFDVIDTFGFVPQQLNTLPVFGLITLLTHMFLHGSISHIAGNMLFLWIFGNAVEAAMGSRFYLLFYLICGVYGVLAQYLIDTTSIIPIIGASGAIAGILGAYIVLFSGRNISVLLFWVIKIKMPALVFIGIWLLLNICSFVSVMDQPGTGGVAYLAHLSGFFIGLIVGFYVRRDILNQLSPG